MTNEEAAHIVDVAFGVPQAVRRIGEDKTYHEDEIREAKDMAIKALEQDPKTGHWIRWYEQKENDCVVDNIPHCKCSECGKEYDPHSSQFIKYCNECGAKMVEPQESEEESERGNDK